MEGKSLKTGYFFSNHEAVALVLRELNCDLQSNFGSAHC